MKRGRSPDVNRVVVNTGAAKQAVRLLRWWADDLSDDPRVLEMIKQSKECARDLAASVGKRVGKKR